MFYEIDEGGFIIEIGNGDHGIIISADRYMMIRESYRVCPADTEDYTHRLSTNIEWVAVPKDNNEKEIEE